MNFLSKLSAAIVLCCTFFSLSPPALSAQDFTSVNRDLEQLENLINDTLSNTREQEKLLEDLRRTLAESGTLIENYETIITGREQLLRDLQTRLAEMSETYRTQSSLLAKYEKTSRFWKTFTLIAVPTAAALSGALVYIALR
jgi:septal ring factor EnvC (AmiA/AmiB activator)